MNILSWGRRTGKTTFCINRFLQLENPVYIVPQNSMGHLVRMRLKELYGLTTQNVFSAAGNKWWKHATKNNGSPAVIDEAQYIDDTILEDIVNTLQVDTLTFTKTYTKQEAQTATIPRLIKKHGFYHKTIYDTTHIPQSDIDHLENITPPNIFKQEYLAHTIQDPYTWKRFKTLYCKGTTP